MNFLALFLTLATSQSAGRMRVWRALKSMGAATLRDGVYLLPESDALADALTSIAEEVRNMDGTADLYSITTRSEDQRRALVNE